MLSRNMLIIQLFCALGMMFSQENKIILSDGFHNQPSFAPVSYPTFAPFTYPTFSPFSYPSFAPATRKPTRVPTFRPTRQPSTLRPTRYPTLSPRSFPTPSPSKSPSFNPTTRPPTQNPTTRSPTQSPTQQPTHKPSSSSNFDEFSLYITIILDNISIDSLSSDSILFLRQYISLSIAEVTGLSNLELSETTISDSSKSRRRLSSHSQITSTTKLTTNIAELQAVFASESISIDAFSADITNSLFQNNGYIFLAELRSFLTSSMNSDLRSLSYEVSFSDQPSVSTSDPNNSSNNTILKKNVIVGIVVAGCVVFILLVSLCLLCCRGHKFSSPQHVENAVVIVDNQGNIPSSEMIATGVFVKESSAPPLEDPLPVAFAVNTSY